MGNEKIKGVIYLVDEIKDSAKNEEEISINLNDLIGDGKRYNSLELILISLAYCSGTTIEATLNKMRKEIKLFKVSVSGTVKEEHPKSFSTIELEYSVLSSDVKPKDIEKAINLAEEKYCPVYDMLKHSVAISSKYKLL